MPYVDKILREKIDSGNYEPIEAGELNYKITKIVLGYLGNEPHYKEFNDVLGVLTAIQHELYRRRIADYENDAIKRNSDVY